MVFQFIYNEVQDYKQTIIYVKLRKKLDLL